MEKLKGYNRNLIGGKRPHKKIQRMGKVTNLAERVMIETKALSDYQYRVGIISKFDYMKFNEFYNMRMKEMKHRNK